MSRPPRDRPWQALAVLVAVVMLVSCAYNKGSVVLLPEKDGRDTAVVVTQGDKQVVLDRPYAAAQQTALGARTYQSSEQEVAKIFGAALGAQPARPARFTLYFIEGKDELTEESRQTFEGVFAEILKHPVPDIVVIGHTDRVGTDPFNDNLARQRADTVRMTLISRGVAPDNVVAAGRGSREPIVPTDAGVSEPRNRRVDIFVR